MLVHDTSGSMRATDVQPDRLSRRARGGADARHHAARGVPARAGLLRLDGRAALRADDGPLAGAAGDRHARDQGLDRDGRGAHARHPGDPRAGDRARTGGRSGSRARSCSSPTARARAASIRSRSLADAKRYKIPVYAIALGTPTGTMTRPDGTTVPRAAGHDDAAAARARRPAAGSSPRRPRATSRRSTRTSAAGWPTRDEKQEVTAAFAGGALALLLGGLVTSLLRTGRLP